jgi:S-adenosylmethionine:tRNA ribosyltransferase-isomerase
MKTSDFDYYLPESYIAQTPLEPRDSSRLLVLNRQTGGLEHRIFNQIGEYLNPGDLLVLNQTRVIPARIFARKSTGGRVELLLLRRLDTLTWECLVGGKGMTVGKSVFVESDDLSSPQGARRRGLEKEKPKSGDPSASSGQRFGLHAEIIGILNGSERLVKFSEPIEPYFSQVGNVPLPPYIHEKLDDPERYQTVYAKEPGSAAAPTAGLHFTPRLLEKLKAKGVKTAYVTLHVGLDTFAPVTEDDPEEHKIHTEWCQLSRETADAIHVTHANGGRVIAVGTTSVRTLESAGMGNRESEDVSTPHLPNSDSQLSAFVGPTSLFILPGYQFKVVDAIITNFHLPKSTLIMLVSAFAGREKILETYKTAIREGYRFYSFGDAMLIL